MRIRLTLLVALALMVAACGGGDAATTTTGDPQTTTTAAPTTTTTVAETTTTLPPPLSERISPLLDLPPGVAHDLETLEGLRFSISVPSSWNDREDQVWLIDDVPVGYQTLASPNASAWFAGWTMEGVFVGISEIGDGTVEAFIERVFGFGDADCNHIDQFDYTDRGLTGTFELLRDCDGLPTAWFTLTVSPDDDSYVVYMEVVLRSMADVAYLDALVDSLEITGDLAP